MKKRTIFITEHLSKDKSLSDENVELVSLPEVPRKQNT